MDASFVLKQIEECENKLKFLKEYLLHHYEKNQPKEDIVLYEKLRSLRNTIAAEESLAPYCILHNSVLKEMCIKLPSSVEELKSIKGFGEVKASKYGERFNMLILAHVNT